MNKQTEKKVFKCGICDRPITKAYCCPDCKAGAGSSKQKGSMRKTVINNHY